MADLRILKTDKATTEVCRERMRRMRVLALGLALGLLGAGCATSGGGTAPSGAGNVPNADVSGTWTGTFFGPNLNQQVVFTLKQVGRT